eukprot:2770853-Amphidinium_carterae.1
MFHLRSTLKVQICRTGTTMHGTIFPKRQSQTTVRAFVTKLSTLMKLGMTTTSNFHSKGRGPVGRV